MRRLGWIASGVGLAALVATGIAVARGLATASGVQPVSATFSATSAGQVDTRTCAATDGTYELAKGSFGGTYTSADPNRNGAATIEFSSVLNTTSGLGTVTGRIRVGNSSLHFDSVNSKGVLSGFVTGSGDGSGQLLGTLTAGFSRTGGFTNGQVGTGSVVAAAVTSYRPCWVDPSTLVTVRGTIVSLDSATIKVGQTGQGGQTVSCAIGPGSPSTSGIAVNDLVAMTCAPSGPQSALTLYRLQKLRSGSPKGDEKGPRSVYLGAISALDGKSVAVTLAGKTQVCQLGTGSPALTGYVVGDVVQVQCQTVNGTQTLVSIRKITGPFGPKGQGGH